MKYQVYCLIKRKTELIAKEKSFPTGAESGRPIANPQVYLGDKLVPEDGEGKDGVPIEFNGGPVTTSEFFANSHAI